MKYQILIPALMFFCTISMKCQEIKPFGTAIYVKDLNHSAAWYEEIFNVKSYHSLSYPELDNLKIELLKNSLLHFELVERSNSFSIYDLKPEYNLQEVPLQGYYKIVFEVKNIEEFYTKIKAKKVEIHWDLNSDEELKLKTFIIKDPDNNFIQFIEKIE